MPTVDGWIGFYIIVEILFLGSAGLRYYALRNNRKSPAALAADIIFGSSVVMGHSQFWMLMYGLIEQKSLAKTMSPEDVQLAMLAPKYLKIYFAESVIYVPQLWFTKFSFLLFYYSFYQHLKLRARVFLFATTAISIATLIVNLFIVFLWCQPISRNWSSSSDSCSPLRALPSASVSYSTNVFTDLMLMVLAGFVIQTLQLRRRDKYGIASVFLIGLLTITFSTVRYSVLYKWIIAPQTSASAVVQVQVWTTVELVMGQIAFCLPSFKKLIQKPDGATSVRDVYTFNGHRSGKSVQKIGSGLDTALGDDLSQTELVTVRSIHASEQRTSGGTV